MESAVRRFRNAVYAEQSVAAAECRGGEPVLFENVGKSPVSVTVHDAEIIGNGLGDEGRAETAVRGEPRQRTPFGVEQGQIARLPPRSFCHLRQNASVHFLPERLFEGNEFFRKRAQRLLVVFIGFDKLLYKVAAVFHAVTEYDVGGVMVRGNKVERNAVLFAILAHVGNMRVVARGGASHPIEFVHGFDRFCRNGVQFVIIRHRTRPKAALFHAAFAAEVGLVPHLEKPSAHLVAPVPFGDVANEGGNQKFPRQGIARRRGNALIMEDRLFARFQARRHKTQFHKGFHAYVQQKIENIVYVGERKLERTVEFFRHHAHVVVEKAVKADVTETEFPAALFELRAVIRPERRGRMATAHAKFPVTVVLVFFGTDIQIENHCFTLIVFSNYSI